MIQIENPPSFVVREEAHKATYENGFRLEVGVCDGWLGFLSTTVGGNVWFAREKNQGCWLISISHSGVAAELDLVPASVPSPGIAAYAFPTLEPLYRALSRVYKLAASLPDAPLDQFRNHTATLPSSTEAERLVVQRIGQNIFRDALMEYWNGRCPLTGITDPALLRASHIVRWADCESDAQRLDVHNGLLLSSLWGAAFDAGLISFNNDGYVLRSPSLTQQAAAVLALDTIKPIVLTNLHRQNLARHRVRYGY